ncbi:haloacid dehalogenase type II [Marinobacter bohaiensis]|uniref:haloacid dehalogenase type II n=1 Tax=Marinobacter bohaiensis TaxID=2201898 RepID=UPI000DAD04CD|nr:haloacid dehalogenase type II [Marinobacter bohaiensis]
MTIHLAFDVYGTLVDPQGMADHLRDDCGERAAAVSRLWRQKQLEFSFRRGLMRDYADFGTCTRQALRTAMSSYGIDLARAREDKLMQAYLSLPAFADAGPVLKELAGEYPCFAFSNGTPEALEQVLGANDLLDHLDGLVSVDAVRSFKPDPAVYAYARRATGAFDQPLCLVSSNAWDVIGARAAGLMAIWVQRDLDQPFDDWELAPSAVIHGLQALPEVLEQFG